METKKIPNNQRKKLEKLLSRGEELIIVTSIGARYYWINFFLLLPFAFLLVGIPKLGRLIRMRQSFTYALSNRRFIIVRGIFSRKIVTAPLTAITHVTVEQSVMQRYLFNTGHLVIITAGFDQREIVIENIGNPVEFKILIEELTEKIEQGWEGDNNEENFSLRALKT
ncbi:MAG: PH domain-containing protein [Candidatus Curtissbacteria bacterium]|nr:PH domain-containing protein [Candidatus Curtissbacteria bacterium]